MYIRQKERENCFTIGIQLVYNCFTIIQLGFIQHDLLEYLDYLECLVGSLKFWIRFYECNIEIPETSSSTEEILPSKYKIDF